jgi:uncharacterized membrane protein YoaK (UPF0700 family)
VASAILTEGARRRGVRSKYILPMLLEAALLAVFMVGVALLNAHRLGHGHAAVWWMVGGASMAMGLQNATVTRISGNVVRTTHLTGVLTDLGLEGVQYLYWWRDKTRGGRRGRSGRLMKLSRRHPTALRLALLANIFGSFLFGVLAGSWAYAHWPTYAMAGPIVFLLWIVWVDFRKPIADTRELDLLGDPELKAYGIVHSLLPKELGIYRVGPHVQHARGRERDPDFGTWVDRLPGRWRVVILALTPLARLSGNSLMALEAAYERLRGDGRKLIVCGITQVQYRLMDGAGLVDRIGAANVCPDLEFAVARGIEVLGADVGEREDVKT